jgi:O-antigen ligase
VALGLAGLLVAWSTLAVGGVYLWARIPIAVLALLITAFAQPRIVGRRDTRLLDLSLLVALAVVLLQITPLPTLLRWLVSPRIDVDRLTLRLLPDSATSWLSLSLDPPATTMAAAVVAAAAATFWSCRHLSGRGQALGLLHVVATVGLVGSVAAIVQRAVDPERIYGIWTPEDAGARPFGPFVNRNHFGTWLLMAVPLVAGAVAAIGLGRRAPGLMAGVMAAIHAFGSRSGWLLISLATMLLCLVLTFSRSTVAGAVTAALVWCLLGYSRATRRGSMAALAGSIVLVVVVVWAAPAQPILARVRETLSLGAAGRTAIWEDARTVARAYPVAGTGLGTFERSMLIYQTTDRRTRTNQAHSQYLQLLAEGGALVTLAIVIVAVVFARLARQRLRADTSPAAWLRIGALSGLAGVAVQGVWETGLRMPANGILLAVAAAIAVHRPPRN